MKNCNRSKHKLHKNGKIALCKHGSMPRGKTRLNNIQWSLKIILLGLLAVQRQPKVSDGEMLKLIVEHITANLNKIGVAAYG